MGVSRGSRRTEIVDVDSERVFQQGKWDRRPPYGDLLLRATGRAALSIYLLLPNARLELRNLRFEFLNLLLLLVGNLALQGAGDDQVTA